tara:strand:+ start:108 stop:869 length:762 start_codon:yes stop_codon:yes gene_type:complete
LNRILLLIFLFFLIQSCGTKRVIYNKKPVAVKEVKKPKKERKKKKSKKVKIFSQKFNSTEDYVKFFAPIAMDEMIQYKIPASITLAQGILESGGGKGRLAVEANNHFGIKCHEWNGKKIYHDDDEKQECFRKYDTPEFSYRDHSIFLANRDRYSFLFKLDKDNYVKWAKGLKKAGYATDPKYPKKLIDLIERYDLDKYDNLVLKRKNKTHRVKKGETLYSIAKKFDMTTENLKALNGIENNEVSIGDRLKVKK